MQLREILTPERTVSHASENSKKTLMERLSQLLAQNTPEINANDIFQKLIERERLGTTKLGCGVAVPPARIQKLHAPIAAFIHLDHGILFDGTEKQPVDLFFGLLVPEEATDDHLQILAMLAEMFSQKSLRNQFRISKNSSDLYQLIIQYHE